MQAPLHSILLPCGKWKIENKFSLFSKPESKYSFYSLAPKQVIDLYCSCRLKKKKKDKKITH